VNFSIGPRNQPRNLEQPTGKSVIKKKNLSTGNMGDLKAPVTRVTETIKTLDSHINYKTGDTWKSNT
jgi:hypothetical protein